jgi:hypothetical protein
MTSEEVKAVLLAKEGQRVRIVYDDGIAELADIRSVDDEGCVHDRPGSRRSARPQRVSSKPEWWWTRFESITNVETGDLMQP